MSLLLKSVSIIFLVNGVQLQQFYGSPPFCLREDANNDVCHLIENFFAFMPFQRVVDTLAGSLTGFTSFIQIQEIVDYVTQSFGPNPLNTTDYESISESINFIIFQPNSGIMPRNISSTDVLMSCDALQLRSDSVKVIWPGYGDNCYGRTPLETLFDWTADDMQKFADRSNSSIIAVEWGFKGLSCYGYIQITLCLIGKISEFFAHIMEKCVVVEKLQLIGHSMGAQIIGYVSQHLALRGRIVNKVIGLDPAGPGYEMGLRCQGIQTGFSNYSMIFHSNPCQLGTCDFSFGDTNVLLNPNRGYCQPNCTCFLNPGCSHSYVTAEFLKLAHGSQLPATYTQFNPLIPGFGEATQLTIYQNARPGYYVLNTVDVENFRN